MGKLSYLPTGPLRVVKAASLLKSIFTTRLLDKLTAYEIRAALSAADDMEDVNEKKEIIRMILGFLKKAQILQERKLSSNKFTSKFKAISLISANKRLNAIHSAQAVCWHALDEEGMFDKCCQMAEEKREKVVYILSQPKGATFEKCLLYPGSYKDLYGFVRSLKSPLFSKIEIEDWISSTSPAAA